MGIKTKYRVGQIVWTYDMANKEPLKWLVVGVLIDDGREPNYELRYGGWYVIRPQGAVFRTAKEARRIMGVNE